MTTTTRRYAVRVRTTVDDEPTVRDYLHEDTGTSYPFRTFAEANAACVAAVNKYADDMGWVSWSQQNDYDEANDGGFWFSINDRECEIEGRACVIWADFTL
jgi:hypothetical protein